MSNDIVVPYNYFQPYDYQKEVFAALQRGIKRIMLVWARQKGKDTTCMCAMVMCAITQPGNYFYIFPTAESARKAVWEKIDHAGKPLLDVVPSQLILRKSDQEMMLKVKSAKGGYSTIRLIGLDHKPDSIRGITPMGIIFSESAYQDPRARKIIMPAVRKNPKCWTIDQSTPNGKNHFYRMYESVKDSPEWFVSIVQSLFPTREGFVGPQMAKEEYEKCKAEDGLDDEEMAREYGCAWDIGAQGAIYADALKDSEKYGQIGDFPADMSRWVDCFYDIGYNDPTVIWFKQTIDGKEILIDYWEGRAKSAEEICFILEEKGYGYRTHYLPFDADSHRSGEHHTFRTLFEDALSQSRMRCAGEIVVTPKIASKQDAIHWVRKLWNRLYFNEPLVHEGIDHLENYHRKYDHKKKVYMKEPEHDEHSHAADALTTMVAAERWTDHGVPEIPSTIMEYDIFA